MPHRRRQIRLIFDGLDSYGSHTFNHAQDSPSQLGFGDHDLHQLAVAQK